VLTSRAAALAERECEWTEAIAQVALKWRWSNSGTEEMVVEEDAAAEHFHGRHAGRGMHGRVMKSAESKPLVGTGTSFFLEGSFCIFYHKLIFYFH
jgi:hypothetical protein